MLKIAKGLKPYLGTEEGIAPYTDDEGNEYVRVKKDDEDFCIAAHDYTEDGKARFSWDDMKSLEDLGVTTFTKKQIELYKAHHDEINNLLKEIGGDKLNQDWYWTSTGFDVDHIWIYNSVNKFITTVSNKNDTCRMRPVINL